MLPDRTLANDVLASSTANKTVLGDATDSVYMLFSRSEWRMRLRLPDGGLSRLKLRNVLEDKRKDQHKHLVDTPLHPYTGSTLVQLALFSTHRRRGGRTLYCGLRVVKLLSPIRRVEGYDCWVPRQRRANSLVNARVIQAGIPFRGEHP